MSDRSQSRGSDTTPQTQDSDRSRSCGSDTTMQTQDSDRSRSCGSDTTTQHSQSTQHTLSPDISAATAAADATAADSLLWVDKYKPTNIRQIIGQQGDRSNARKLLAWLQNWHANLGRKPACKYMLRILAVFLPSSSIAADSWDTHP